MVHAHVNKDIHGTARMADAAWNRGVEGEQEKQMRESKGNDPCVPEGGWRGE